MTPRKNSGCPSLEDKCLLRFRLGDADAEKVLEEWFRFADIQHVAKRLKPILGRGKRNIVVHQSYL